MSENMHPAIGKLLSGKFYAYVNGYSAEPVMGTLEEVEVAMGLRERIEAPAKPAQCAGGESTGKPKSPTAKTYDVTLSFQYPAWDEKEGIRYTDITASSKSEANSIARKLASSDGHLGTGKGRATFVAIEQ